MSHLTCGVSAIASQSELCVGKRPMLLHLYTDKATATRFPAIYASFCSGAWSPCMFLNAEEIIENALDVENMIKQAMLIELAFTQI